MTASRPLSRTRRALAGALGAGLAALAGLAGLACNDANEPLQIDTYPYKIVIRNAAGQLDSVAFHWRPQDLPLRIWVEDAHGLRALTETAVERWDEALRHEEFEATFVADSAGAQVIVRFQQPPQAELATRRLEALARECQGAADIFIVPETETVEVPIHVYVHTGLDEADPDVQRCLDVTTTHELGHAIGIFAHSPNAGDVMHGQPTVAVPTYRDVATVRTLYRGPSDLEPEAR